MSRWLPWLLAAVVLGDGGPRYRVGRPATPEQIGALDITVFPDGRGLPAGHGTAREGKVLYQARCASCHGQRGEGTPDYPPLAGGFGTLVAGEPVLTVGSYWPYATTAWDYIHRAMPYDRPGTLRPDEVYALTAYVLHLSGNLREDETLDEKTLPAIRMPNRDGFVRDDRPDVGARRGAGRRP
jgi:cytochrome c